MPPQPVPRTQTRRRESSPTFRALLVGRILAGEKQKDVAKKTGMSKSTLSRIYKRYREGKGFTSAPRGGPRKTSKRTDWKLLIQVKRSSKMPLRELQQNVVPEISKRTINRRLAESDIKKWLAAERPLLEKEHAAQRLEWALKHKDWTEEDWLKVDWSDECSVERSEGEANVWVFRTRYQSLKRRWSKEKERVH